MKPLHSWALAILVIAGVSTLLWIGAPAKGLPTIDGGPQADSRWDRPPVGGAEFSVAGAGAEPARRERNLGEASARDGSEGGGAESREGEEARAASLKR